MKQKYVCDICKEQFDTEAEALACEDEHAYLFNLIAQRDYDGRFTIMVFTSNYKVMLGTPCSRDDIDNAMCGKTVEEAMNKCVLQHVKNAGRHL